MRSFLPQTSPVLQENDTCQLVSRIDRAIRKRIDKNDSTYHPLLGAVRAAAPSRQTPNSAHSRGSPTDSGVDPLSHQSSD